MRSDSSLRSGTESLRAAFKQCRYRIVLGRQMIDLRVDAPASRVERLLPRCAAFSVMTACNPRGVLATLRDNRAADQRLADWLATAGMPHWRAMNGEGLWREPSWLIGNPPPQRLDQLATGFGQLATLHWRRGDVVRLRWHIDPARDEPHFVDAGGADP